MGKERSEGKREKRAEGEKVSFANRKWQIFTGSGLCGKIFVMSQTLRLRQRTKMKKGRTLPLFAYSDCSVACAQGQSLRTSALARVCGMQRIFRGYMGRMRARGMSAAKKGHSPRLSHYQASIVQSSFVDITAESTASISRTQGVHPERH